MNRTRKALGTVRMNLPPRSYFDVPTKLEKDGSRTCRIHGTTLVAARRFGLWRAIWTRCPSCYPLSARRSKDWRDGLWM